MKTRLHSLTPEFEFAGLTFPKYVWTLPPRNLARRLERYRRPITGDYYHAPKPVQPSAGIGFYLGSDSPICLRWQWCDTVARSIRHTGWYTDEYGYSEKIRGLVFRLPRSRGFLAGWSMGEGMASSLECYIYDDATSAALASDIMAEQAAEAQRQFLEQDRAEQEAIREA